jgi:hypothetical protein
MESKDVSGVLLEEHQQEHSHGARECTYVQGCELRKERYLVGSRSAKHECTNRVWLASHLGDLPHGSQLSLELVPGSTWQAQ